jgi:hypothetical protein
MRDNPLFDSTIKRTGELASDAAQVLNSMVYDVSYNIHDHYSPESTNPLSTVAMHPREEYNKSSGLFRAIERFDRHEIYDRFGLSLEDYLNLPRDVIDMLTEVVIDSEKRMENIESQERSKHNDGHPREAWGPLRK